jgi:hypothetical protein
MFCWGLCTFYTGGRERERRLLRKIDRKKGAGRDTTTQTEAEGASKGRERQSAYVPSRASYTGCKR